jgi:4-hydroxy-tetrahydrodipicolinate synthase
VQIILPYYFVPTEEGMYQHYKQLADAIDIGIIIYNNPAFSKSWIGPKLMKRIISDTDGKICGIKENTPHLMLFNALVKSLKGTGVSMHSGFGEQWYAYQYPWGADGFVTPFGNFFPEYPIKFYEASLKYDFDAMRSLLDMMDPYYAFVGRCSAARPDTGIMVKPGGSIYGEGNVRFSILKEAMNLMGLPGGHMRLPLMGISAKERDELKEILRVLKLL